ncbi:uncharacterized protein KY384_008126 [Bacidia gigantensis]|uniref:uncharacterized protein n=1 Tax=Bacidia gigantensis TaxID=2732470 RepID=UPI001D03A179|nr:uncharacterized protein KY384_008126 [Bacidia gigantensis]KAG8526697.1 hypothetical protein KY384_008126 [Bacidia gigantensis]
MAARNRPRNGLTKDDGSDAHEESIMWTSIVSGLRKLQTIQAKASDIAKQQIDLESKLQNSTPTVKDIDELQELYREGVRLAEEEQKILNEEPSDIIKNIGILAALRAASETEPVRQAQTIKPRNPKRQKIETDGAADSPSVSPGIAPAVNKLKIGGVMRSVSVPRQPEPIVKIEEGTESNKPLPLEKVNKLVIGADVAYKQAKPKEDGSQWIQCIITNITGEGNKKKYEVQDPEPEDQGPGQVWKTSANTLIPIPAADTVLPDFPIGKTVLARYPETTTFYRAEVQGLRKDNYRLKFEEDQGQDTDVARRFVLDWGR